MNAAEIATRAASLVSGEREQTHGDKRVNFGNIAHLWNAWLQMRGSSLSDGLTGADVSEMMELLKIARRHSGEYNADDYVDTAGYAAVTGELRQPTETMR